MEDFWVSKIYELISAPLPESEDPDEVDLPLYDLGEKIQATCTRYPHQALQVFGALVRVAEELDETKEFRSEVEVNLISYFLTHLAGCTATHLVKNGR